MGAEKLNDMVGTYTAMYKKVAKFPTTFIPTSGRKGEITLLEPTLVSKFFKTYNKNLASKYRKVSDISKSYGGINLTSLIEKVCK